MKVYVTKGSPVKQVLLFIGTLHIFQVHGGNTSGCSTRVYAWYFWEYPQDFYGSVVVLHSSFPGSVASSSLEFGKITPGC